VNSGSSANLLALSSLQLPKGSKVVTPACTFATAVAPMVQLGLEPVFVDVELQTYVPSVEQVMAKVDKETRVIMVPNLVGNKMDWKTLRERVDKAFPDQKIILLEDSCDTITHTIYSDISTTSFYASHIITAGGCGGMVMYNNKDLLAKATMYRDWGRTGSNIEDMNERFGYKVDDIPYDFKFTYSVVGYNFKASEMNAAFGLVQLKKLDNFKKTRRENVERFLENFKDFPKEKLLLPNDSQKSDWLAIPFQTPERLQLLTYLEERNIQTRVTFAGNITRHAAYRQYLQSFPNADTIMANGFLLGAHHGMTKEDVDYVCTQIKAFFAQKS